MPLYDLSKSGDLVGCWISMTDTLTTLKEIEDRIGATQLLRNRGGALEMQLHRVRWVDTSLCVYKSYFVALFHYPSTTKCN